MCFSCGSAQFKTILEYLDQLEEEMGDLKERISDYSAASRVHEEKCEEDDLTTANKLNSMNDKVTTVIILLVIIRLSSRSWKSDNLQGWMLCLKENNIF